MSIDFNKSETIWGPLPPSRLVRVGPRPPRRSSSGLTPPTHPDLDTVKAFPEIGIRFARIPPSGYLSFLRV